MAVNKNFVVKNGLEVGGNSLFVNSTTDRVGIGTTNPRFALEVGAVGASGTSLYVNGDARITGILTVGTSSVVINGTNNKINVGAGITLEGNTGIIRASQFYANDMQAGVITATTFVYEGAALTHNWISSGPGIHTLSNVGIGTTNPTSALTVTGDIYATGVVTATSFVGDGSALTGLVAASGVTVRDDGSLIGTASTINFGDNLTVSAISAGVVTVTTGTPSQWVSTAAGIHTLSSVGIGTTNPTSALTVKGNTSLETLDVSGVSTFAGITTVTGPTLFAKQLNVSGVSTFSNPTYITGPNLLYFGGTPDAPGSENLAISNTVVFGGLNVIQSYNNVPLAIFSDNITLGSQSGENFATFGSNGAASLYYDDVKKFETLGTGVTVTGTTFTNQLNVSGIATFRGFGSSNVQIGNTSYYAGILWGGSGGTYTGFEPSITTDSGLGLHISGGQGDLILSAPASGGDVIIRSGSFNPTAIYCRDNAEVELYYQNSQKFETLGTGVTVTGTTFTNGLSVSGVSTFAGITTVTGPTLFSNQLNVSGVSTFNSIKVPEASSPFTSSTNNKLVFGNDLNILSTNTVNYILTDEKILSIGVETEETSFASVFGLINVFPANDLVFGNNSYVTLGFGTEGNNTKLTTIGTGVTVTGTTFTNQLNVSGVSTFAGITTVTGPTLFTKQLNVSGVSTFNNDVNFRRTNGSSGVYWDASAGDLRILNSASASITFGDGDNTELLFDGTDFLIKTESLKIKKRSADENIAVFTDDSSVELYFDNSKKFETLGTGVTITGQISASAGVLAGTLSTFPSIRVANDAGNNTAQYVTNIGPNYVIGFNTGGGYPENKYFQFSSGNPNFILENVGIGTTNATSKLTVRGGDISVGVSTAHGVILTSPNGTQYRLIVADNGTLSTVAV